MAAEARSKALIIGAGISGLAAAWCFDENVVRDSGGRELLRLRYKDVHGGVDALAVCRDDLARVLANAISESVVIRFGETVVKIEDDGSKAQATLSTGKTLEADLLIGADGIRSSTRNYLWEGKKCLEDLGYTYAVYDIEGQPGLGSDCVSFNSPGHLDVLYTLRNHRVAALHIWRDDQTQLQDRESWFDTIRHVTSDSTKLVTDVVGLAERNGFTPLVDSLTMVSFRKRQAPAGETSAKDAKEYDLKFNLAQPGVQEAEIVKSAFTIGGLTALFAMITLKYQMYCH
ncbi:hypothetical protein V2G26_018490 [Clonostachys chloroleuca]